MSRFLGAKHSTEHCLWAITYRCAVTSSEMEVLHWRPHCGVVHPVAGECAVDAQPQRLAGAGPPHAAAAATALQVAGTAGVSSSRHLSI